MCEIDQLLYISRIRFERDEVEYAPVFPVSLRYAGLTQFRMNNYISVEDGNYSEYKNNMLEKKT